MLNQICWKWYTKDHILRDLICLHECFKSHRLKSFMMRTHRFTYFEALQIAKYFGRILPISWCQLKTPNPSFPWHAIDIGLELQSNMVQFTSGRKLGIISTFFPTCNNLDIRKQVRIPFCAWSRCMNKNNHKKTSDPTSAICFLPLSQF